MRIHTDNENLWTTVQTAAKTMPGVYANVQRHGSRSRAYGYELRLEGNGTRSGYATKDHKGATWDEWGVVLGAIFDADPDAFAGSAKNPVYASRSDYHRKTGGRFADHTNGLPKDTHSRHVWEWELYGPARCKRCTAVQVR